MARLYDFIPSAAILLVAIVTLGLLSRLLARGSAAATHRLRNQLILFSLTSACLVVLVLALPLGVETRGQLLGFIGIVMSAAFALSSTTFLGNALAGLMLRAVRNFSTGDFIRIGDHFGRVSERGLFHTEIQSEDRELTMLPNLYLVTNPVTTLRRSGTVIAATVSLGYDVPRRRIEERLLEAARRCELSDPFVQITDLGDFSVGYRVAGILEEVKRYVTARSRLRGAVLDALHEDGIEIVSPNFMNTRMVEAGHAFVPPAVAMPAAAPEETAPEDVVFDKADEAETLDTALNEHAELEKTIHDLEKSAAGAEEADVARIARELAAARERLGELEAIIDGDDGDEAS